MKRLLVVLAFIGLTGCAGIMEMIPSRWDDNQSKSIIDIRVSASNIDCKGDQKSQFIDLTNQVKWFELYAKSKGTKDIAKLNTTLVATVQEFNDRINQGPVSPMYCDLKKKIIEQQADIISHSVMGRF
jgi:hypothetical protein